MPGGLEDLENDDDPDDETVGITPQKPKEPVPDPPKKRRNEPSVPFAIPPEDQKKSGPSAAFQGGNAMKTFSKIDNATALFLEKFHALGPRIKGIDAYRDAKHLEGVIGKTRGAIKKLCEAADKEYKDKVVAGTKPAAVEVNVQKLVGTYGEMMKQYQKFSAAMKLVQKEMRTDEKYWNWRSRNPIKAIAAEQLTLGIIKTAATHGLALVPGLGPLV